MGMYESLFGNPVWMELPWFFELEDYKMWAKGRSPYSNMYAYLDMVKERQLATMLEF